MVRKLIAKNPPSELECSSHPEEMITFYNRDTEKYVCNKCEKPKPDQSVVPITKELVNSAASKLYGLLDSKKKSIEGKMERISKFMLPENEEPLRSQEFLETTKLALEEVQNMIEQEEESKELFMIKESFLKEL
jgi:hypothetical protein